MIKANGNISIFYLALCFCLTSISSIFAVETVRLSLTLNKNKYQMEDVSDSWYYHELVEKINKDHALLYIGPSGLATKNSKIITRSQLFTKVCLDSSDDSLTTATIDNILIHDKPFDISLNQSVHFETSLILVYYDDSRSAYLVIDLRNHFLFPKGNEDLKYSRVLIDRVTDVYNNSSIPSVSMNNYLTTIETSDESTTK